MGMKFSQDLIELLKKNGYEIKQPIESVSIVVNNNEPPNITINGIIIE